MVVGMLVFGSIFSSLIAKPLGSLKHQDSKLFEVICCIMMMKLIYLIMSFDKNQLIPFCGRVCFVICLLFYQGANNLLQAQSYLENPIILNSQNGLDVGDVSSVAVDKNGFLWIAGSEGLQRYDGIHYKKYTNNPEDSSSLIANNIYHIDYEEESHSLWISTWSKGTGLCVMDLTTGKFKNYYYEKGRPGGIISSGLIWSFKDKFDQRWIGSKKGLAKYLPDSDSFQKFSRKGDSDKVISLELQRSNALISYSIDQLNDSLVWLGARAGVSSFNVITGEFVKYHDDNHDVVNGSIRKILHHTDEWVYIATWGYGLYRLNPKTNEILKCNLYEKPTKNGTEIDAITMLFPKSKDVIWVGTELGLIEYNTETGASTLVGSNQEREESNANTDVRYKDRSGRLFGWAGEKINIYDPIRQQVERYDRKSDDNKIQFLPRRILEESLTNDVWVTAQMSEGLYKVNLNTNEWEVFPPPAEYFIKNKSFSGWDIIRTQDGELLVLSATQIYKFSESENKLKPWELQPKVSDPNFRRIIEDRYGNIWIGCSSEGLFRIDGKTNEIRQFKKELTSIDKNSYGEIWDLQEDRNGNIWIRSEGFNVYDAEKDSIYNFPYFYPEQEIVYHIETLGIDDDGNAWICAHKNRDGFIGITDADHPENGIRTYLIGGDDFNLTLPSRFLLDDAGNNWLLGSGIEKLSPERRSEFLLSDAYLPKEYKTLLSEFANGNIAVGYRNGFGVLDPDNIRINELSVVPYVLSFSVFDEEVDIDIISEDEGSVVLKPSENFFTIGLSALNTSLFGDVEFLYKLEGVDPDWVDPQDRAFISYTDISGGDYVFRLKARQAGREWNKTTYELNINIGIPWYRTWWAILFWIALMGYAIYSISRILLAKKIANQEADKLRELDEFKTRFYANITHEFRTPLTVISGMAEELGSNLKKEPHKKINLIRKNSQSLLALVNQILDLSKLQAGKINANVQQSNVVLFLKYLTESHQSFAKLKNVGLQFYSEESEICLDFDAVKMEQVLNNLISNAVKFTQEYGNILIVSKKDNTSGSPVLEIKVKDNGIGISDEQLPYIFDRFHQVDPIHGNQGSGIGLALVKELMGLMDGEISVESEIHKGTTFYLRFPIKNTAPITKPISQSRLGGMEASQDSVLEIIDETDDGLPILLIIEDNLDVTFYLRTCLEEHYQILSAINGEVGLAKAKETLPDIIISDVMMPEMDGFEVCAALKKDDRTNHIPIILLTARATSEDKLEGLSHGADAYLIKPFKKEELEIRMENLLEIRRTLQEKYSSALLSSQQIEEVPLSKEEVFVKKLEKVILAHLDDEQFSIHHLSRELMLSRSQAHRKIKALTGMSTAIYIRNVRLQKAKELLLSTDLPISEIAYQVGFKTMPYFSQAFKDTFGESPSATRI